MISCIFKVKNYEKMEQKSLRSDSGPLLTALNQDAINSNDEQSLTSTNLSATQSSIGVGASSQNKQEATKALSRKKTGEFSAILEVPNDGW